MKAGRGKAETTPSPQPLLWILDAGFANPGGLSRGSTGIQKLKDHPRAEASSKYKKPSIFFYVQHKQLFHGKKKNEAKST